MKLSQRLEQIASFVEPGNRLADIGTDHGYIPICLVQEGRIPSALAMDVKKGPLERAEEHIREAGLSERIETRLSDGLSRLEPGEAETAVIAGMGGELEIHILEAGRHVWNSISQWILSPQSDLDHVRRYLLKNGFFIRREEMVKEDGKFYTIMDVAGPSENSSKGERYEKESYYFFGKHLIQSAHPVLAEFLEKERKTTEGILELLRSQDTKSAAVRIAELEKKMNIIEEAQDEMRNHH